MSPEFNADVDGATDVGQLRRTNEDAILVDTDNGLFVLADGMGGHGAGDVASQLAIEALRNALESASTSRSSESDATEMAQLSNVDAIDLLSSSVFAANTAVYEKNAEQGHTHGTGMGTTLVGLCLLNTIELRAVLFHVGDSRLYEYNGTELIQLTADHTMYKEWEDNGRIGPAPPSNIILRAIGLFADVEIDVEILTLNAESTYILCSDGLSDMLSEREIMDLVDSSNSASDLNKQFITRANELGGVDNISVISILPSAKNSSA